MELEGENWEFGLVEEILKEFFTKHWESGKKEKGNKFGKVSAIGKHKCAFHWNCATNFRTKWYLMFHWKYLINWGC